MSWNTDTPPGRDGVTIPRIGIAFAFSVLVHLALLWQVVPRIVPPAQEATVSAGPGRSLSVQIAPPASAPARDSAPPQVATAIPAPKTAAPKISRSPAPAAAPALASAKPPADNPVPAPALPSSTTVPAREAPSSGDFAAFVDAQRRARTTPEEAVRAPRFEDDKTRANRVASANLSDSRLLIFGYDPNRSGGVFKMQRTGVNDAEFMFYGWNSLVGRSIPQLIEVKRGNHSDIRAAIASKMASIIRESVKEDDFLWDSRRLRRVMTLSARIKDNAELEAFLLLEFEYL